MPCMLMYAYLTCQTWFRDAINTDPTLLEYRHFLEHEAYLYV